MSNPNEKLLQTKSTAWNFINRYVPAIGVLSEYSSKSLGRDALAGVTVATVAVPQAMAYALIAGLPPQYGLFTAIVMTLVGSLLDSSRQLINGPTNAISIAVFSAVAFVPQEQKIATVSLLALLVGLIQIGTVVFRLANLTRFVSHTVITGFTLGAAFLLAAGQLKNMLGLEEGGTHHGSFVDQLWLTLSHGRVHLPTVVVGLATILIVLALSWGKRMLPEQVRIFIPDFFLSLVIASFLVWGLGLERIGVRVVGEIPAALPAFSLPELSWLRISQLGNSALAIAVLGLLESIAMAKAIAAKTGQKVDLSQQCLSEGVANSVAGLFQCLPGSGSLTRSIINQRAGAVSQWSGVIAAVVVGLTVLFLAPLAYYIPYAALSGLLIISAWRIIDHKEVVRSLRNPRYDTMVMAATGLSAIFISVEVCILIGIFLSMGGKLGKKALPVLKGARIKEKSMAKMSRSLKDLRWEMG